MRSCAGLHCLLWSSVFLLLQGCSSIPLATLPEQQIHFRNDELFGPRPGLPAAQDLYTLTAEQQADFLAFLEAPTRAGQPLHRRMYDYLEMVTENFSYQEDTFTAGEALQRRSGNCLTLAILTTALARQVNLEIGYQLVNDMPVYEFGGTTVLKGVHVRSIIYDPGQDAQDKSLFTSRSGYTIDYFPSKRERFIANLPEQDYIAMYYMNIAVKSLQQNDLTAAYWNVQEALLHSNHNPEAINMLAVINRRVGAQAQAEALYRYGIEHASDKLSLLKNYQVLLQSQGRVAEAAQVAEQLASMEDPSPFHWFLLAQSAMHAGEVGEAIRYYRKALELAPYLHEAWLGLAQANYEAGRIASARQAMQAALEHAGRMSTRKLYQAKLRSLTLETAAQEG